MNPQAADMLSQLRDIHAAPMPSWWPPAPGWWVLAVLLLLLLVFLGRRAVNRLRVQRRRRQLLHQLDRFIATTDAESEPQAFLSGLNRYCKSVALRAFPGETCAPLQGAAWAHFLQKHSKQQWPEALLSTFESGPYQPVPEFDRDQLAGFVRRWVSSHG
jgi:hypothetical protein